MLQKITEILIEHGCSYFDIIYTGYNSDHALASLDLDISYEGSEERDTVQVSENDCFNAVSKILLKLLLCKEFKYPLPKAWKNGLRNNRDELEAKWNVLQLLKEMNNTYGYELFSVSEIQATLAKCKITYTEVYRLQSNCRVHSQFVGINGSEKNLLPENAESHKPKVDGKKKRLFDWKSFANMGWNEESIKNEVIKSVNNTLVTEHFPKFSFSKVSIKDMVVIGQFDDTVDAITQKQIINIINSNWDSKKPSKFICL